MANQNVIIGDVVEFNKPTSHNTQLYLATGEVVKAMVTIRCFMEELDIIAFH